MNDARTRIAVVFLRTVGCLLVVLGIVHLVATPHIPGLLRGSPRAVYQQAVGPTLLNHVLVGILLFPFGYTTLLAAAEAKVGEVCPAVRHLAEDFAQRFPIGADALL